MMEVNGVYNKDGVLLCHYKKVEPLGPYDDDWDESVSSSKNETFVRKVCLDFINNKLLLIKLNFI